MNVMSPVTDIAKEINKAVTNLIDVDDHKAITRILQDASYNIAQKLDPHDKITLFSMIYTSERLGLTPLHIQNVYNFSITKLGNIKRIKTKAWDKSRNKIQILKIMLIQEVEKIAKNYGDSI